MTRCSHIIANPHGYPPTRNRIEARPAARFVPRLLCCATWIAWLAWSATVAVADRPQELSDTVNVVRVGNLENRQLEELSGLAASTLSRDILWAVNDGGHDPVLYAVSIDGSSLASIGITSARNIDWEDLAAFRRADRHYLMIADIGDNARRRALYSLYVVEEPRPQQLRDGNIQQLPVSRQIDFRYEDGPQDCEAVAVDSVRNKVFLLSKHLFSSALYELPLVPAAGTPVQVARRLGRVPNYSMVTAMDISPDQSSALVLTYQHVYLIRRKPGENWSSVLKREPLQLAGPVFFQQEAACFDFSADSVYISSEGLPAPLVRIDLADPHHR